EADEAGLRGDLDFFGLVLEQGAKVIEGEIEMILEGVAHGDELDAFVGFEGLATGAGATAAAADESDLDRFVVGGAAKDRGDAADESGTGEGGGGFFDEGTAGEGFGGHGEEYRWW